MRLGELVIDSVTWHEVEVLRGAGGELAETLRRFVHAGSAEEVQSLWDELEGVAFAQNTIYGAALSVVDVMLAVLADRSPDWLRPWAVEVLRFIVTGDSETASSLRRECLERARVGRWLLAAEACRADSVGYRDALIEILDAIDHEFGRKVAAATA